MHLVSVFTKINLFRIAVIIIAFWQLYTGSYIYTKAQLAQILLNSAWTKTLQGEHQVKPWDWADTYPIAKITFNSLDKNYIVLAGGNGRTMAFGPGHISSSPLPGNSGNSVIVGHRDTHFAALENLTLDDEIVVELPNKIVRYKISNLLIVDKNQTEVMQYHGVDQLTLITCYPFNSIYSGGPLRYIVQANLIKKTYAA